jgi:hypothetical protein
MTVLGFWEVNDVIRVVFIDVSKTGKEKKVLSSGSERHL